MLEHYKLLGISPAATSAEIRRAFRILARRYHPDVNPGKGSSDKFRQISEAYHVLSDPEARKQYDQERSVHETFSSAFDRAHQAYRKQQSAAKTTPEPRANQQAKTKDESQPSPGKLSKHDQATAKIKEPQLPWIVSFVTGKINSGLSRAKNLFPPSSKFSPSKPSLTSLSVVEVSISVFEAITGIRKTIEISESPGDARKVSISIPAGVWQGSVLRLRSRGDKGDEIIAIIRVAHHPWLSISHRGLTVELPITISESMLGAKVQAPTLDEPIILSVEPGTQSGTEVRLKGKGILLPDSSRGDLYIRFLVKCPANHPSEETTAACKVLERGYAELVREGFPRSIVEGSKAP